MAGESWLLEKSGSKRHANYTLEWSLLGTSCSRFKIQISGPLAYRLECSTCNIPLIFYFNNAFYEMIASIRHWMEQELRASQLHHHSTILPSKSKQLTTPPKRDATCTWQRTRRQIKEPESSSCWVDVHRGISKECKQWCHNKRCFLSWWEQLM